MQEGEVPHHHFHALLHSPEQALPARFWAVSCMAMARGHVHPLLNIPWDHWGDWTCIFCLVEHRCHC